MAKQRLSKEVWLTAGFRAMAETGPKALNINHLCRALGTTKGSFYWHFKDLSEYEAAMLDLWRDKVATEIVDQVTAHTTPAARLNALISRAAEPAPDAFGGQKIEVAMRAWALSNPKAAEALALIDAERLAFLTKVLEDAGAGDAAFAQIVYAAYIGIDDLAARERLDLGAGITALGALITRSK